MIKKSLLFCATLTSKQDWAEPIIVVVDASSKSAATRKALKELGCTYAEIREMVESEEFGFKVTPLAEHTQN